MPRKQQRRSSTSDLSRIEHLLEKCWSELDGQELNAKLMDIIRLMELKSKLTPAAQAEQSFWSMIERMRQSDLPVFPDVAPCPEPPKPRIEFAE